MTKPTSIVQPNSLVSAKSLLICLLVLALVRGIIYASIVPPWQAPDEPAQFERVRAALSADEWANIGENDPAWYTELDRSLFTFNFWDFLDAPRPHYSSETPLSEHIVLYQKVYNGLYGSRPTYALMGWPLLLASQQDIILQLYLVRLNTVLMNVGIIWLAYLIVRTIFPQNTFLAWGVPFLIMFNPQHTHMLSTVNNGNLAELLTTAALYFMVKGIIKGFTWLNVAAVLGFALIAMWTKATAYFLPIAIGGVALFYLWQYRRYWRWLLPVSLVLAGLGFYFAPQRLKLLAVSAWDHLYRGDIYLEPIVLQDLFRSFWAMPGWTIFYLHPLWYWLIGLTCLLALGGLIAWLVGQWPLLFTTEFRWQTQALIIMAVAIVAAIGIILSWNALTKSIVYRQGRSLYPVIIPISIFLMLGWRQFIPASWRDVGLIAASLLFFLLDSLVLFDYIIPIFYSRY